MSARTAITLIASSPVFTSEIIVQGMQRLNVSIRMGSVGVSDPVLSTFSGIITLQRQFADESGSGVWRDVQAWTIAAASAMGGGEEVITTSPEPETVTYRIGAKSGEYYSVGAANVRLGTSGGV
jgi:hypothetical protein